jgi:hypothetical protein
MEFVGYKLLQSRADHTGHLAESEKFVACTDLDAALRVATSLRKDYTDVYQPPPPIVPAIPLP